MHNCDVGSVCHRFQEFRVQTLNPTCMPGLLLLPLADKCRLPCSHLCCHVCRQYESYLSCAIFHGWLLSVVPTSQGSCGPLVMQQFLTHDRAAFCTPCRRHDQHSPFSCAHTAGLFLYSPVDSIANPDPLLCSNLCSTIWYPAHHSD